MRSYGTKAVMATMVIFFLSGCSSSLSQIRENEPYRILTSTKSPQGLAKCIEMKIRAETGGGWYGQPVVAVALEEHPNHNYRIGVTLPGVSAIADILVKPTDSGSVVEYRKREWGAGDQSQWLEIIERCAQ
jgi:hypothetical protein